MDENESKRVIVNAWSFDESELKGVHIIINTIEVKDAKNKRKYEETSVINN